MAMLKKTCRIRLQVQITPPLIANEKRREESSVKGEVTSVVCISLSLLSLLSSLPSHFLIQLISIKFNVIDSYRAD